MTMGVNQSPEETGKSIFSSKSRSSSSNSSSSSSSSQYEIGVWVGHWWFGRQHGMHLWIPASLIASISSTTSSSSSSSSAVSATENEDTERHRDLSKTRDTVVDSAGIEALNTCASSTGSSADISTDISTGSSTVLEGSVLGRAEGRGAIDQSAIDPNAAVTRFARVVLFDDGVKLHELGVSYSTSSVLAQY